MAHVSNLYKRKFSRKVEQFNKPLPLPEYFRPMIGDKKIVYIAELGAGPVCTIGDNFPGVYVRIFASDIAAIEYADLWDKEKATPLIPVLYGDMENLLHPDDYFDVVHCRNAADHTPDIYKAISEMMRVCKKGGYVYLAHAPSQKTIFKGHHYWDIEEVDLRKLGFSYSEEDGLIINTWQKI